MTSTETKLGSPQLFVVSVCVSNEVHTALLQADTWQQAAMRHVISSVGYGINKDLLTPDFALPDELCKKYPTIRSLKSALWAHELISFSISVIRPAVAAIDTGYVQSDDGPLSATTVKVAVEHMSLYDDVVYVP
mgnify:CR=1 FL=1